MFYKYIAVTRPTSGPSHPVGKGLEAGQLRCPSEVLRTGHTCVSSIVSKSISFSRLGLSIPVKSLHTLQYPTASVLPLVRAARETMLFLCGCGLSWGRKDSNVVERSPEPMQTIEETTTPDRLDRSMCPSPESAIQPKAVAEQVRARRDSVEAGGMPKVQPGV
jgi:hypothetical protein